MQGLGVARDPNSPVNGINAGLYDDPVHTDRGWRIARRRFTMVHARPFGDGIAV